MFKQPRPESPLKVVIAYENDAAFHAAMEIYRGLAGRLTDQFEFHDYCWRIGDLAEPALFERAVSMAAGADVVFCCPGNSHVLPRLAQGWIQQWISRRTQSDGVLALLLPVKNMGASIYPTLLERDLRETAHAGGLDFFTSNYLADHSTQPTSSPPHPPVVFRADLNLVYRKEHGADLRLGGSTKSANSTSHSLKASKRNDLGKCHDVMKSMGKMSRVLVVDDDPLNLHLVTQALTRAGFSTAAASDGEEAMEQLLTGWFDAVVSDVQMPRMSGIELLQSIRTRFPCLPVILMTSRIEDDIREATLRWNATGLYEKPVDRGDLILTIRLALHESGRLHRESELVSSV